MVAALVAVGAAAGWHRLRDAIARDGCLDAGGARHGGECRR
ncbi:hypothetical protein [Methylobacterium oryzihabitans]|nr:hypothetical protein [Methylobacterium oryzihabitans]